MSGAANKRHPSMLIRGGTVVDATGQRISDIVVADGVVAEVGQDLTSTADLTVDASGCFVGPGLVDLHAHLRQPGDEAAETVQSGSRAAALGGFTAVVAMPDTDPIIDCAAVVREVQALAADALCDVAVAGAITVGCAGEKLAPMGEMAELGVRLFTDNGTGVQDARLMRRALEYAAGLGVTLAQDCNMAALSAGGHMHEGPVSSRLGIPGIPAEAEELMVMRDIALARLTGASVHFQHLSTASSVAMVQAAKAAGLPVTAEVTPHHLSFTDKVVESYDPVYKVRPPFRSSEDREAIRVGLAHGAIDAVASDHTPHQAHVKEQPFEDAECGVLGLQTALSVVHTELDLPIAELFARMSWRPALVAGLSDRHGGPIKPGRAANLCVFDPNQTWTVRGTALASLSRNTPYDGETLTGMVRHTIFDGEAVVLEGEAQR